MRAEHHDARHLVGDPLAVMAAQQIEAEIDPRRDPRRGGDAPVLDIERAGIDGSLGIAALKLVRPRPVGRAAPPVQQPGGPQHECPGADRGDLRAARMGLAQRGQQRRGQGRLGVLDPRHDHQIGPREAAQTLRRHQHQPGLRRDRSRRGGADLDRIAPARTMAEHMQRRPDVERDGPRRGEKGDAAHGRRSAVGRK